MSRQNTWQKAQTKIHCDINFRNIFADSFPVTWEMRIYATIIKLRSGTSHYIKLSLSLLYSERDSNQNEEIPH